MISVNSELKVYYTGLPNRSGYILVSTDHYLVGNSYFSLPKLDDFFLNVTHSVQTFKYHFDDTGYSFIVYYHDPGETASKAPLEMIVFRMGAISGRLVNLCPANESNIRQTLEQWVSHSFRTYCN
jgi:hypothetical protein